jgi:thioredoxin 1
MASELTDAKFNDDVLKSKEPVLVDLWAPWCGPCRMLSPVVEKLSEDYKGKIKVFKLNTEDNPNTASTYSVQAIPTLLFFKGGQLVDQIVGVKPEKEIRARLDGLLK